MTRDDTAVAGAFFVVAGMYILGASNSFWWHDFRSLDMRRKINVILMFTGIVFVGFGWFIWEQI